MPAPSFTRRLIQARDDAEAVQQTSLDLWNALNNDGTLTAAELVESIDAARGALTRLRRYCRR